jgi:hypothetical protein
LVACGIVLLAVGICHAGDDDCLEAGACVSQAYRNRIVAPNQTARFQVQCPADRPHFWNWDLETAAADDRSLISANLVAVRRDPVTRQDVGARIDVINHEARAVAVNLSIGCSTRSVASQGTGRKTHTILNTR